MAYTPTAWVNDQPPALSSANLNKLTDELESQASHEGITHSLPTWSDGSPPALTDAAPLNEMERVIGAVATALGLSYTPTTWGSGWTPARDAVRFNRLELQAQANRAAIESGGGLTPEGRIVITAGGTYSGHYWQSSGTGETQADCAVVVQTGSPVTIENCIIENTGGGRLLQSAATGSQVTIRNCHFIGVQGGVGRAIAGQGWRSWVVENCTIEHTGGIYFQNYGAAYAGTATVLVRYNRHLEVSGGTVAGTLRQFCQFNTILNPASIIVEWNEVLNTYGTSIMEDCVSVFGGTSNVVIRNNFLRGGYANHYQTRTSGCGIVIGDYGGSNNVAHDNQIVAFDGGIGISGGANNHVYNNRLVTDGRYDGVTATVPNQGLICYTTTPGSNNTLYGNYVGWCQSDAFPAWSNSLHRTLGYTPTADNNVAADNTLAYGNLTTPMTAADEDAEWAIWQNKLTTNGITIGASI